ncbi:Osmotin, thaumatin-like protein [Lichtheimia hyalospora FSU 10163]|nr:Osmotin, thaumatin-like protein [Lichtheimia hyalospora FSU 10163]
MVQLSLLSALALAGVSLAAPSARSNVGVTIKNHCDVDLDVYKLTNGHGNTDTSYKLSSGASKTVNVDSSWAGRFWACSPKDPKKCNHYGSPVSLAEFKFSGFQGVDFYDISFVDGFNLPVKIKPNYKEQGEFGKYDCGAATCSTLPSCPAGLEAEGGACKSACAAFGTDEYCCTGSYNGPNKCTASKYARHFKSGCSDAYSYAYDDPDSTFGCSSNGYTVTFCP